MPYDGERRTEARGHALKSRDGHERGRWTLAERTRSEDSLSAEFGRGRRADRASKTPDRTWRDPGSKRGREDGSREAIWRGEGGASPRGPASLSLSLARSLARFLLSVNFMKDELAQLMFVGFHLYE
jgi:hypothetical protein